MSDGNGGNGQAVAVANDGEATIEATGEAQVSEAPASGSNGKRRSRVYALTIQAPNGQTVRVGITIGQRGTADVAVERPKPWCTPDVVLQRVHAERDELLSRLAFVQRWLEAAAMPEGEPSSIVVAPAGALPPPPRAR